MKNGRQKQVPAPRAAQGAAILSAQGGHAASQAASQSVKVHPLPYSPTLNSKKRETKSRYPRHTAPPNVCMSTLCLMYSARNRGYASPSIPHSPTPVPQNRPLSEPATPYRLSQTAGTRPAEHLTGCKNPHRHVAQPRQNPTPTLSVQLVSNPPSPRLHIPVASMSVSQPVTWMADWTDSGVSKARRPNPHMRTYYYIDIQAGGGRAWGSSPTDRSTGPLPGWRQTDTSHDGNLISIVVEMRIQKRKKKHRCEYLTLPIDQIN